MQLLMSGLLWSRTPEMREIVLQVPFVLEGIYIKCTLHDLEFICRSCILGPPPAISVTMGHRLQRCKYT